MDTLSQRSVECASHQEHYYTYCKLCRRGSVVWNMLSWEFQLYQPGSVRLLPTCPLPVAWCGIPVNRVYLSHTHPHTDQGGSSQVKSITAAHNQDPGILSSLCHTQLHFPLPGIVRNC